MRWIPWPHHNHWPRASSEEVEEAFAAYTSEKSDLLKSAATSFVDNWIGIVVWAEHK